MFSIDVKEFKGLESEQRMTKFIKAMQHAESAINSIEFMHWFMAFPFEELYLTRDENTPKVDLYNRIMQKASIKYGVVKRPWYKSRKVVGYESKGIIYTYSDYYDSMTLEELADHLAHESVHALGFSHKKYNFSLKSVPYAVGNFVEKFVGK